MEQKKKMGFWGILLTVITAVLLAVLCVLSSGLTSWTPTGFRFGVYRLDNHTEYQAEAYLQTNSRDVLITDRSAALQDGDLVTYRMDGQRVVDFYDDLLGTPKLASVGDAQPAERVTFLLKDGGVVLQWLHSNRFLIWGGSLLIAAAFVLVRVTAGRRWRKRQQQLMRKNFQTYGEKYEQEDENSNY